MSNSDTIGEIKIIAKKKTFERKIDRLVFNVENSVNASTGTAYDAVRLTPGIIVLGNEIRMVGKSGLLLIIDDQQIPLGGEQLINFLRTIPSSTIKSIEVISTPPAKYDAKGNSGIIRIVLKVAKRNSWNAGFMGAFTQQSYSSGEGGANFTYQKNKFSFYSVIYSGGGGRLLTFQNKLFYPSENWISSSPNKVNQAYLTSRIGMSYAFSPKWKIGATFLGSLTNLQIDSKNYYSIFNTSNNLAYLIHSTGITTENPIILPVNIHSIHTLDTLGRTISFDLDYFSLKANKDGSFNGNRLTNSAAIIPGTFFAGDSKNAQNITNLSAKMDVELPLKWINLSLGGKITNTLTKNNFEYYDRTNGNPVLDTTKSNVFSYRENIQAIYLSGSKKLSDKWEVQLGLRLENTMTRSYSKNLNQYHNYNYLKLFPSLFTTYQINDHSTFSITYSRRINRPYFEMLNPFRWYQTPYNYSEGNPFLQPSFTDNFELIYNTDNNELKLFASNYLHDFGQLAQIDAATNIVHYYYLNYLNTQSIGVSESYTFNKFYWWNSVNMFAVYYSVSNSTTPITVSQLQGLNSSVSSTNDFVLNKKKTWMLSVGAQYAFKSYSGVTTTSAYGSVNAGIKSVFLNGNLVVNLFVNDIFRSEMPTMITYSNNIRQEYVNYYDNRNARISLVYKIGNRQMNVNRRNPGNSEERERTGK